MSCSGGLSMDHAHERSTALETFSHPIPIPHAMPGNLVAPRSAYLMPGTFFLPGTPIHPPRPVSRAPPGTPRPQYQQQQHHALSYPSLGVGPPAGSPAHSPYCRSHGPSNLSGALTTPSMDLSGALTTPSMESPRPVAFANRAYAATVFSSAHGGVGGPFLGPGLLHNTGALPTMPVYPPRPVIPRKRPREPNGGFIGQQRFIRRPVQADHHPAIQEETSASTRHQACAGNVVSGPHGKCLAFDTFECASAYAKNSYSKLTSTAWTAGKHKGGSTGFTSCGGKSRYMTMVCNSPNHRDCKARLYIKRCYLPDLPESKFRLFLFGTHTLGTASLSSSASSSPCHEPTHGTLLLPDSDVHLIDAFLSTMPPGKARQQFQKVLLLRPSDPNSSSIVSVMPDVRYFQLRKRQLTYARKVAIRCTLPGTHGFHLRDWAAGHEFRCLPGDSAPSVLPNGLLLAGGEVSGLCISCDNWIRKNSGGAVDAGLHARSTDGV